MKTTAEAKKRLIEITWFSKGFLQDQNSTQSCPLVRESKLRESFTARVAAGGARSIHFAANSEGLSSLHPAPEGFSWKLHTECRFHTKQNVQVSPGMQRYQEQSRIHQGGKNH